MSHELPPRRNLESLKKEAKRWLDALHANDRDARERLHRALPDAPAKPTLRDVQHALAREQGYAGWSMLKGAVEQWSADAREAGAKALALYEAKAEALLEAYRTGSPEAMERHYNYTWHRREWRVMRTYVQLDLGKRPAHPDDDVEITVNDARHLIAVEHGFANWSELEAFTRSLNPGRRVTAKPLRLVVRKGPDDWQPIAGSREWDEILELLAQHPSAGLSAEGQMTDELLAEVSRVDTLTALGLSGCKQVTDEGVRHLARLPSLQHLDLTGTSVTDAGLEVLRHLPRLRTLSLASNRVTVEGVGALAHCNELEHLKLWVPQVGDAALRALAGKRRLHHLEIALTDAGLPLLHELPVFKSWQGGEAELSLSGHKTVPNHLSLRGTFTDRGMRHLRGLEGLFSLDIDDSRLAITAAGLEPLISLAHLAALGADAKDDWMPHMAEMPHLRYLGVQDTVAGDEGFVALSRSQSIESIWGRRCHNLRTRGFTALASMPALRSLSVSCLNVDDVGVSTLPTFPALKELMPMDVPDAGYRHISRCEQLESLIQMYCRDTTDAATEHITRLHNLTHYFNSYTTITDRTPELLSTMDSLERITFDACHGLTNTGIARLARLPKLRELRVAGKGLTSEISSLFPPRVTVFHERS
jgi:Leucine-rich repeat (LRR) protein